MLASHRHEHLLGGSAVERHLSGAAERQAAAAEALAQAQATDHAGGPNAEKHRKLNSAESATRVIALLATWKHVAVQEMAQTLLDMTSQQRTALRQECVAQSF